MTRRVTENNNRLPRAPRRFCPSPLDQGGAALSHAPHSHRPCRADRLRLDPAYGAVAALRGPNSSKTVEIHAARGVEAAGRWAPSAAGGRRAPSNPAALVRWAQKSTAPRSSASGCEGATSGNSSAQELAAPPAQALLDRPQVLISAEIQRQKAPHQSGLFFIGYVCVCVDIRRPACG